MSDNLQLHEAFASQYVQPRHVEVWLPPSYHRKATQRFGVLYMHDGQNLFRPEDAFIGVDWGIMPAMEQLIAQRAIPETIVVGIWNTGKRYQEYLPQKPYGTPFGQAAFSQLDQRFTPPILSDAYLQFIVTELKPFIDSHYRTRSSRAQTVIMGSSMGGLISLYALCEYPEIFGGAGCISTHWPAVSNVIRPYLQAALPHPGDHRLYFDYGTVTLDALYEPHQQQVDQIMRQAGYTAERDWLTRRFEGAEHSERAWRQRVHYPLQFLLAPRHN